MRCGFCSVRTFHEFNVAPENEDILDFMDINNMSLGTPHPLHVYVELMEEIAKRRHSRTSLG
jgi:hypothetical protein